MKLNDIYIYTISCPISNKVKYVGKTINPKQRFRKHLSYKRSTKLSRWIKGIKNKGLSPVFAIIETCTYANWQEIEKAYIADFKNKGLAELNDMPGGEGGPTMLGKKLTQDQVKKIVNSKIGKSNPAIGKTNVINKGHKIAQYV